MDRRTICFLGFISIACIAYWVVTFGSGSATLTSQVKEGGSVAEFLPIVELPPCEINTPVDAEFEIRNGGQEELHLTDFITDCSCKGLEVWEDARFVAVSKLRIPPGEAKTLRLRQVVKGVVGRAADSQVRFRSNDPRKPACQLVVRISQILGGLQAVPTEIFFGTVTVDAKVTQTIHLYDSSSRLRAIERITCANQRVTVVARHADPTAPDREEAYRQRILAKYEIEIDVSEIGELSTELHIVPEGGKPYCLPVRGRVVPVAEFVPPVATLRQQIGGGGWKAVLVCRNRSTESMSLAFNSCPEGIKVKVEPRGSQYLIFVEADRPSNSVMTSEGVIRFSVSVGAKRHEIELPFRFVDDESSAKPS